MGALGHVVDDCFGVIGRLRIGLYDGADENRRGGIAQALRIFHSGGQRFLGRFVGADIVFAVVGVGEFSHRCIIFLRGESARVSIAAEGHVDLRAGHRSSSK